MNLTIDPATLTPVGKDLVRPECVLATRSGTVFCCDARGGIMRIGSGGSQHFIGNMGEPWGGPLVPNGITMMPDGSFLAANLADEGGVWRIALDGETTPHITEVDGMPLLPANFVARDAAGRIWITVSARSQPRTDTYHADAAEGFLVLVDDRGARIVAEGFGFTNEAVVDPQGAYIYVNETFGRRLTRFSLGADGSLGPRETVMEFGHGIFLDGMAFDAEGGIWLTSVISNRLIRLVPGEAPFVVFEDPDARLEEMEADYHAGIFGKKGHMTVSKGAHVANLSSLAFGGPDLKTIFLGSLNGNHLLSFRSPIAGAPPVHWNWSGHA
ncbi:SMP-30/gluconolactonase/LRE family protein [Puniceibacterium sp. IMCC21224]|uniref:SMP-30/gluconolactonase/LRE family protein n=1 Tax=Puniceibacterium sp. IMCC21224 TaxID=1618204 RepID=UPI00064E09EB|nr:SMP-30/gluconolactonase/LRE family protein [Puniceibacterium sp. IMCC21224]KMK64968.1 gluconolactonase [Puniceibacterium sp. IMCC21224]